MAFLPCRPLEGSSGPKWYTPTICQALTTPADVADVEENIKLYRDPWRAHVTLRNY